MELIGEVFLHHIPRPRLPCCLKKLYNKSTFSGNRQKLSDIKSRSLKEPGLSHVFYSLTRWKRQAARMKKRSVYPASAATANTELNRPRAVMS